MKNFELTVGEVTQMAILMEEKGMNFYRWAAGQFDEASIKNMYSRLAEEEKEHARVFQKILESVDSRVKVNSGRKRYFQLLAGAEEVFSSHRGIGPDTVKSPADALFYGIQAEKDAILFYQEMFNTAESQEVKDTLSKLLEQEKMHLVELRDSMDEVNNKISMEVSTVRRRK